MNRVNFLAFLAGAPILQACEGSNNSINSCKGLSTETGYFPGLTMFSGSMERSYILYIPVIDDPSRPMPLVFNVHGLGSNGEAQFIYCEFDALADRHKFIIVSPDGISNSWNAGDCCAAAMEAAVDDVGFTADMIEQVSGEYCVRSIFQEGQALIANSHGQAAPFYRA